MTRHPTSARFPDPTIAQLEWLRKRFGNRTTAQIVAIDRLYQSERRTLVKTIYTVPTETEAWGPECVDGRACADAVIGHLVAYAQSQGWDVEFEIVPSQMSRLKRPTGNPDIIQALIDYESDNWTDWVPASAYLDS